MARIPIITPGSIQQISPLPNSRKPIFFLTMAGNTKPSVVVKLEHHVGRTAADKAISLKWSAKMMRKIDEEQLHVKIMTADEVSAFRSKLLTLPIDKQYDTVFRRANNMSYPNDVWVKMPYIEGISTAGHISEHASFQMSKVTELLTVLSDQRNWYQLGRIIVVDIFNGNTDRFNHENIHDRVIGVWINRTNLVYAPIGDRTKIIGLDAYDPNNVRANLNLTTYNLGLRFLNPLQNRIALKIYAQVIVIAIAKAVTDKLYNHGQSGDSVIIVQAKDANGTAIPNKMIPITKGGKSFLIEYSEDLLQGMHSGIADLKAYLIKKKQKYDVAATNAAAPGNKGQAIAKVFPPAVAQRMKYLGWGS